MVVFFSQKPAYEMLISDWSSDVFSSDLFGYRSALMGSVVRPDLTKALSRRQRISMGEESEYAYVATQEALQHAGIGRSEERRVGKECVSMCISRWSPNHETEKTKTI